MKIIKRALLSLLAVAVVFCSLNLGALTINAAAKKVACPIGTKWVKSGNYQFQLTNDNVLKCKKGKKTIEVASYVVSAFVYGSEVAYKTTTGMFIYEAKINTSNNITMKYAEKVSSTVPISDVILAGYGKGIIYYAAPVNKGQDLLFSFDYKAAKVDFVASYGYINKVYSVDKYIYIKTNTSDDGNSTGCLSRIDVTTGKEHVFSYNAITASFDNKNVYWAEPAGDLTYTLGIGSINMKSCKISDTKAKTIAKLDDIDTYKAVVCMPKFVTCTSKTGVTFKYTFKDKKKTAYESYQQKDLMSKPNVLH